MLAAKVQSRLLRHGPWQRILATYPYPAALTNARHAFLYINPAFATFYGKRLTEVIGLTPWILMPREYGVQEVKALRRDLIKGSGIWTGPFVNVNAAGKRVRIYLVVLALRGRMNHEPIAYLSLAAPEKEGPQLLPALARHLGEFWLEQAASGKLPKAHEPQRGERQEEVLRLTRMGYSTKEVATFMGIATSTVANVKWKLNHRGMAGKRR